MKTPTKIFYSVFHSKSVFVPLRYIYPECYALIQGEDQLHPLKCMKTECHRNSNCSEVLANRIHYFFENVIPGAELLVTYFKYDDKPDSIRAGIFTSDLSTPRVITCNKSFFKRIKEESTVYSWEPPTEFLFMGSNKELIQPEDLIRA